MKGKFWLFVSICAFFVIACSHKKKISFSGDVPVDIKDFIASFEPVSIPFQVADTSVVKTDADTLLISHKVLSQFIHDSTFSRIVSKSEKARIYPLSRIAAANGETFLLIKVFNGDYRAIVLLCFDKKNNFLAGMPVLIPDANPATEQLFTVDKRYTISKSVSRRNPDGTTSDGKNVYVLNEASNSFLLIMTDALDEQKVEMINPIEALSKKSKFSGDYVRDKWNLVSIRDAKKQNRFIFFVHFEKKNDCTGELKGEASFTGNNVATYRGDGDFCVLQFNFKPTSVTITELEGCGSHRGMACAFEGTFPKKKEVKKKEAKPSNKKTAK